MPRQTLLPSLLAAALGALGAAALTAWLVGPGSTGAGAPSAAAVLPEGRSAAQLAARVEALLAENRALAERVQALELRPVPAAREPAGGEVSQADLEALRDDLLARLEQLAARRPAPADLEEQVQAAMATLRKREAIENVRRSNEKQAAATEQWLGRLQEKLGLDAYQVDQLRILRENQLAHNEELTRLWEEGADEQVLGEAKRTYAEEQLATFQRVLTPEQWATYRGGSSAGNGK